MINWYVEEDGMLDEKRLKELSERITKEGKQCLLNNEDPWLEELCDVAIGYYSPDRVSLEEPAPELVEFSCTIREYLLLQNGLIEPSEIPAFIKALSEEDLEIDEHGDIVDKDIGQLEQPDNSTVKPEDIARQSTNLPEEKINSVRNWFVNLMDRFFGKGR